MCLHGSTSVHKPARRERAAMAAATKEEVEVLKKEVTGIQAALGSLKGMVEEMMNKVKEMIGLQTVAMNTVVDEAKREFSKIATEQKVIIEEGKVEFQKQRDEVAILKGDCEKF